MTNMYMHDYFNNRYVKAYRKMKSLKNVELVNGSTDKISAFLNLMEVTCAFLKHYLNYQGLFQFDNWDVIREAFYVELIDDGDVWIEALFLFEACNEKNFTDFEKLCLEFYNDEKFSIFENLYQKFKHLEDKHEKT